MEELPWRSAVMRSIAALLGVMVVVLALAVAIQPGDTGLAALDLVGEVTTGLGIVWATREVVARAGWAVLGWHPVAWRDVRLGGLWFLLQLGVGILVTIAFVAATPSHHTPSSNTAGLSGVSGSALFLVGIAAVLVAPVVEETLFRGVLLRAFEQRLPFPLAALASSVLFGGLHAYEVGSAAAVALLVLRLTVFGYLQCVLVRRTGRLAPAAVAHGAQNLLSVLVAAAG